MWKHAKKQMKQVLLMDRCNNNKSKSKLDKVKILWIVLYLRKDLGHLLLRRFMWAAALPMFAIRQSGIIEMKGDTSVSSKVKKKGYC